ncbi:MAG: hypothetical protein ACI9S8_000568 [Chlamydiales bacterium]|jgi:hypothetical protein
MEKIVLTARFSLVRKVLFLLSLVLPVNYANAQNYRALSANEGHAEVTELRYNEVQFKVAFDSRSKGPLDQQLAFSPYKPWEGGCLGIELGIVQNPKFTGPDDNWEFSLQNGDEFQEESPSLRQTLQEISKWSSNHPGHHVVTIHIAIKGKKIIGDDKLFCEKFDDVLANELGIEKIFTPAYLQRDASSLLSAVQQYGWPTLEELRGNFIVVLTGDDSNRLVSLRRMVYTYNEPYRRLAFVDIDHREVKRFSKNVSDIDNPGYREGSRVFLNIKFGHGDWIRLADGARKLGLVTRLWKVNTRNDWNLAKQANVNLIATDMVHDSQWTALTTPVDDFRDDIEMEEAVVIETNG